MEGALLLLSYLAWFGLLAAILYLPGLILARVVPASRSLALPPFLSRIAFGASVWMAVLFAFSVAGLLNRAAVWTVIAVLVLLAAPALVAMPKLFRDLRARAAGVARPNPSLLVLVVSLGGVLVLLFFQALSPEVATDAQVYHLQVPKLMIGSGGFRPIPFNVYSHWPMNLELLFALALLLKDHVLASLVHFLFGALTVASLVLFGRQWQSTRGGLLAAGFFLANGVVLFEMPIAYVDVAAAFFLFVSFWCAARALASTEGRTPNLLTAGVFCGVLAGTKLNAVIGCVALGLAYVSVRARQAGWARALGEATFGLALPCAALAVPWYIKCAFETGNPFYPLLYEWLGGIEWNAALAEQFDEWHRGIGMGREPLDYLLLPFRVATMGGLGYDRFAGTLNPAWIVLVPASLLGARRRPIVAWCLAAGLLYFALWSLSSQQSRFLIPALPLLSAAAGMAVSDLLAGEGRWRRIAEPAVYVASAAGLIVITGLTATSYGWRGPQLSAESREQAVPRVFRQLNQQLPATARVLFVSVNRAFFCEREVLADSFFEASQVNELLLKRRSSVELLSELRSRGITHVLRWRHNRGLRYPRTFRQILNDPRASRLVFEVDRYRLYELLAP